MKQFLLVYCKNVTVKILISLNTVTNRRVNPFKHGIFYFFVMGNKYTVRVLFQFNPSVLSIDPTPKFVNETNTQIWQNIFY